MKRLVKVMFLALILLTLTSAAFGGGVAVGYWGQLGSGSSHSTALAAADEPAQFETFWEAWDIVHDEFVDREALDATDLEYGAIRGMITALGDEGHTAFMTPEELDRQRTDISGKFSGIGAQIGVRDGMPMIIAPFDGTPAELAGVRAGDIIMEVDGEDVASWSLMEVVEHIRGEEGTEVVLTMLRTDEGESVEITITRGEITVPAAPWAMIPDTNVALIRLNQFSANANGELETTLREAKAAGATGLVLDVRNNPGGLLEQAVRVTSQFLSDGNVLQQEDAHGNRRAYPVLPGGLAPEVPMIVLTNQGTASSAEIFAGAMQDHLRGQVVGETTFGTGTVLQPFDLEDGSGLMLGTSQWLTANGRLIRKQGIEPNVVVELPISADLLHPRDLEDLTAEELLETEDIQLLKALELLNALPD
ncbi:S41 family peptidase [Chloroflexota bacterium]